MIKEITRCRRCVHVEKTGIEDPYNKCSEIQFSHLKYDNHFKEENNERHKI